MNPNVDPLHAGIAGITMDVDEFDLGEGLVLRKTFAHFMAPFLMAFAPPKEDGTHPTPWSAVSNGLGFDIQIELYVPASFQPQFFDRLNTVWWIGSLIRLKGAFAAHVPAIADRPFAKIASAWNEAKILPVEVLPRRLLRAPALTLLSVNELEWLKQTWLPGGRLMNESKFNDAFQAVDSAGAMPTPGVALLAVWGALEHLFSPAKQELRFRVSANIAAYLEEPGQGRVDLHRKLMKLYDARSGVAHGPRLKTPDAWPETYAVANRILLKMLSLGHVPSQQDLEQQLFGVTHLTKPCS
jgi:hypothetical protein